MIFTGSAELTIDAKQRLAIPAKYRSLLTADSGNAWCCLPWPGEGLMLFTPPMFEAFANERKGTLTPGEDEQELETTLFGLTETLEMDSAGRIVVPKKHMELTGLGSEVVVIGARYRLVVKDRAAWTATLTDRFTRLALQAQKLRKPEGGASATGG